MDDDGDRPSLPSNYLTFLHLKQRWLQQQQQQSSSISNHQSDPQSSHKPKDVDDSTSKPPIESLLLPPRIHHHNPIINQRKPDVTLHDSASKTPKEAIHHSRFHHRVVNQSKPDGTPKEVTSRRRNRHRVVNQPKPKADSDDSASKPVVGVGDDHQMVKKKEHDTDRSDSKPSTTNDSSRRQNPRVVTKDQIPTEVAPEKKQRRNKGRRNRNRSQELRQPKGETPPVVDALSGNGACGGGVEAVEAVAAGVKEINVAGVRRRTDRRWGSGRFYGGPAKPPAKKGQTTTTTVWVRKGESGSN